MFSRPSLVNQAVVLHKLMFELDGRPELILLFKPFRQFAVSNTLLAEASLTLVMVMLC